MLGRWAYGKPKWSDCPNNTLHTHAHESVNILGENRSNISLPLAPMILSEKSNPDFPHPSPLHKQPCRNLWKHRLHDKESSCSSKLCSVPVIVSKQSDPHSPWSYPAMLSKQTRIQVAKTKGVKQWPNQNALKKNSSQWRCIEMKRYLVMAVTSQCYIVETQYLLNEVIMAPTEMEQCVLSNYHVSENFCISRSFCKKNVMLSLTQIWNYWNW